MGIVARALQLLLERISVPDLISIVTRLEEEYPQVAISVDNLAELKKGLPHTPSKETISLKSSPNGEGKNLSFPDAEDLHLAIDAYNQVAKARGLPVVQRLTQARRTKLTRRLKDCNSLEGWYDVCSKVMATPFLHGENDRGWRADFDFLLQESSFNRVLEGYYDGKDQVRRGRDR